MRRHLAYAKYLFRHKWFVFWSGLKVGPGRIWLWPLWIITLLIHDWDKFTPGMWQGYAETFYQPDGSRQPKYEPTPLMERTWNRHQKWNKHHWQHWVLLNDSGSEKALPMPDYYLREMLADWMGAGRAIVGSDSNVREWYEEQKVKGTQTLHSQTRRDLQTLMDDLGYPNDWYERLAKTFREVSMQFEMAVSADGWMPVKKRDGTKRYINIKHEEENDERPS